MLELVEEPDVAPVVPWLEVVGEAPGGGEQGPPAGTDGAAHRGGQVHLHTSQVI